jgi:ribosomal protein S6--L-glutamate ligase
MAMRILLLSAARGSYTIARLREAAIRRGHRFRVRAPLSMTVVIDDHPHLRTSTGATLTLPDAVLPRVPVSGTLVGTTVARQLELEGVFVLNPSAAISLSRDKFCATQHLQAHGVPVPATVFVNRARDVAAAVERVGGPPVIVKRIEGTQGVGVMLAESAVAAEAIVHAMLAAKQPVMVQHFVEECRGRDLRALVVGDRVVAAARRSARPGEFRSNVHRGGTAEGCLLTPDQERIAVRAARALGVRLAGVDILESKAGPLVMEVNSSPGLAGIEACTGIDIATAVIEALEAGVAARSGAIAAPIVPLVAATDGYALQRVG